MRVFALALGVAGPLPAWGAEVFLPEQTMVFEDISETGSDEDMNDAVVRLSGHCDFQPDGDLVRASWSITGVAAGASVRSALVLRLPAGLPLSDVTIDRGGAVEALQASGSDPVELWDDFRGSAFAAGAGTFVNTVPGQDIRDGTPVLVTVTASVPTNMGIACPAPDLVLQPSNRPEVDLASTIGANGRPLAGRFDGSFQAAIETTSVSEAYHPHFLAWVDDVFDGTCDTECSGAMWYEQPVGGLVIVRPNLDAEAPLAPTATCDDDAQNQSESSLDCGDPAGVCTPCDACSAIAFDGNDQAMLTSVESGTAIGSGTPWTFEGWFRLDAAPSGGPGQEMSAIIGETCDFRGVKVQPDRTLYGSRWPNGCSGTTQLEIGTWHHFALTGQFGNGTPWALYLDGALECSGTATNTLPSGANSEWLLLGNRSGACHSEGGTPGGWHYQFEGALKDIRISDTIRYTAPFAPPTTLTVDGATRILWSMNEGSGATVDDTAGASHDLELYGPTWQSAGPACTP